MAKEYLLSEELDIKTNKRKSPSSNSHRLRKRTKLLLEDDSEEDGSLDSHSRGVSASPDNSSSNDHIFAINQEFAQRFEHNKKREERQRRGSHLFSD